MCVREKKRDEKEIFALFHNYKLRKKIKVIFIGVKFLVDIVERGARSTKTKIFYVKEERERKERKNAFWTAE